MFVRHDLIGKMLSLEGLRWAIGPRAFKLSWEKWICLFDAEKKNKLRSWPYNLLYKTGEYFSEAIL